MPRTEPRPTDMFSMQEAALYIGVSYETLMTWRARGPVKIPAYKHGPSRNAPVTFRRADLDAYLASVREA